MPLLILFLFLVKLDLRSFKNHSNFVEIYKAEDPFLIFLIEF